jgi:hypothetical protein
MLEDISVLRRHIPHRLASSRLRSEGQWLVVTLSPAAESLGGSNAYSGMSTSRTLMLRELRDLLAVVPENASKDDYRSAVVDDKVALETLGSNPLKDIQVPPRPLCT